MNIIKIGKKVKLQQRILEKGERKERLAKVATQQQASRLDGIENLCDAEVI